MALPRVTRRSDPVSGADIAAAARGIGFARTITGWEFKFEPSIGLVAKNIDRLGVDIRSFKEPLSRAVKQVMIPSIRKNFDVGGRPPWEPLSEATIKLRGYEAWPILVRTGKLKKAATSFGIWDIGQTSATIRSLPNYAWYGYVHQAGYGGAGSSSVGQQTSRSAAKVAIPQRQFVMFQSEDITKIQEIFYLWLTERVDAVGRLM